MTLSIFYLFICHLYVLFGEFFVHIFIGFFKSSLQILDTNPSSNLCSVNIFSQSVTCLFIFLMLYSEEQNFLILTKSSGHFFTFMVHAFDILSKKLLAIPSLQRFSSKWFIVLAFTFRPMINFKLIFLVWLEVRIKNYFLPTHRYSVVHFSIICPKH